ncbi:MerR family transcriptional regulator [Peribacillus sp. SCS-155]|uniref:MerR family transcriptional regulator n=1 Tax=Peribacillus sedimenti TaxID=3115297 RepID=UPI0039063B21
MGELAAQANVTKRTIDYYTNMGLLKAERSASNYRYYTQDSVEKLRFIEQCKQSHLSLEEIKEKLIDHRKADAQEVTIKIQDLEQQLSDVLTLLKENKITKDDLRTKYLSPEGLSLLHSLLLLLV